MKGIKDYFSSPIKQVEVDSRNLIIQENINPTQCKQEFDTNQDQARKKRKRKKKRKHSDPAITDVTQLLSDNLKFSPNSSQAKLISIKSNPENIKSDSATNGKTNSFENTEENKSNFVAGCIIKESKLKVFNTCLQDNKKPFELDSSSKTESDDKNCQLNAFQFMMNKRNKSIGSNSPGKELIKELPEDAEDNKEKLVARRHLFLNWSELKGGEKRKRFEQDKDEIIKHKLNERTKRFKTLLKVESENNKRVKSSKRKRIKKISSSSDENDKFEEKVVNGKVSNGSKKRNSRRKENLKKSIHHKILESSSEAVVEQKDSENYMDKKGSTHINNNTFNDIGENITNLEKEYNQTKPKKGNLLYFIKSDKHDNTESINITNSATNQKKANRKESSISKSTKQSKVARQTSAKSDMNDAIIKKDEEASQESVFTPRTLRSWKMKIKMKADEGKSKMESNESIQKIPINNIELLSSDDSNKIELSSGSEYDESSVKFPKKALKIAPIFTKSTPKAKPDPAIIEARKQFLMSGIPLSLKKVIERQNSVVDQQEVFPVTSHVQQKCNSLFWNLPQTQLKLLDNLPTSLQTNLRCEKLTKSYVIKDINIDTEVKKVVNLKALLNKIKKENPDYPVNKSFRQIYSKTSIEVNKIPEKRKRGKKRKDKISVPKAEANVADYSMWTEKYKPKSSQEIMGNSQAIKRLKKWLEDWKQFSQEIHSKQIKKNSSDSEFEATDCDSRDSSKLPGKIIILEGPCGTGKTTAVYAICNELGFNVIELNASNKRTGKRLLQELQEATQSHQVRNRESQSFHTFFQSKSEISEPQHENKMCVLLIEDVDLVFEQDDGFISALLQLTATSKRPIIATTTDYSSSFVQKFFGMYEFINFLPLSSFSLATWLQIVFLVEGSYVSRDEIGSLLEFYKGDVRKTLLQLQFWIQSGGQTQHKPSLIKIEYKRNSCDEQLDKDEVYDNVADKSFECDSFEHKNFISTFEILEVNEPFRIPYYLNLDLLWWNIPNILNIPNYNKQRIDNIPDKTDKEQEEMSNKNKNKEDLLLISKVHDTLSFVDVLFKNNFEPSTGNYVKDSLELCENFNNYKDSEFLHELTHYLVNGCISNYGNKEGKLDVAMPDKIERRWKSRLQECEREFKEALHVSTDQKSTAIDYMPVLRNITRSECARAANNTKRGNRFRNYLRDVGVKCQDKIITNACRIFNNDYTV